MLPTVNFPANTVIFQEGSLDKSMFIVLDGSVKIYVERKGTELELAVINKFDFFGEMALYRNRPRSAFAKVLTDCKLVVIKNQSELQQFIIENPSFAGKMMVIMGNRLASSNDLMIEKDKMMLIMKNQLANFLTEKGSFVEKKLLKEKKAVKRLRNLMARQ
ncbi:MAG: cyclic nucleotide-binding domain-containing protein [Methylococcales bacterium]|jgi:CRP-like cAMP-binding protein|nr:cyclic nucleotide-binding domain-containing protein [Methylococcales bacterium]